MSALLINGSQQVLYDPAGTFTHPDLPRRGDIHYGMTPRYVDYYERYHARFSHHVEAQQVPISRAAADQLIANAQAEGKVMKTHCALAVADVLRPVPPFETVPRSYFPEGLRADFAAMPGVRTSYVREVDVGKNPDWERSEAARPDRLPAAAGRPRSARPQSRGRPCTRPHRRRRRSRRRQDR